MKIGPYVEKLENSKAYKEFRVKYPDNYMIAGFFILDLETGNNIHQIDFYVPSKKKIAAFSLDGEIKVELLNTVNEKIPEKLTLDTNIDLDALPGILTDEMHNRGISEQIRKIIAVIQNVNGERIWDLNCVLTGMEILRSHIEDKSETVLKIEKTSIVDIMKRMPSQTQLKMPEKKEDVSEEIKKLEKLQSQIEKEKSVLRKQLEKKEKKSKALEKI